MGTLNKQVNLFKGIFSRIKKFFTKSGGQKIDDRPQFTLHKMMTRKYRGPVKNRKRQYHGQKQKHHHFFGGCNEFNPQAIFIPKRTKMKGYMKDSMRDTFNKRRKAS